MRSGWLFFPVSFSQYTFMRASSVPDCLPGAGGPRSLGSAGEARQAARNHCAAVGEVGLWGPERSLMPPGRQGHGPEEDVSVNM